MTSPLPRLPEDEIRLPVTMRIGLGWTDAMSTGNKILDMQHKAVFRKINELSLAVLEGTGAAVVESTITFLNKYAARHFGREEACMARYHCPFHEANTLAHKQFLEWTKIMGNDLTNNGATDALAVQVVVGITDWICGHIYAIDTNLRSFIEKENLP